jgi:tetratricopeptide (TPR) repeat protein
MRAVSAGVLLAVPAVASTLFVRQIQRERRCLDAKRIEADEQRLVAERRKTEAETRRAAAEDLVGFMLSDLKPSLTRLGRLDLMRGVAKQVDAYYERVTTVDDLDRAAVGRRAEAIRTLGEALDEAGEVARARRAFETAIGLLATGGSPPAIAHARIDLALTLQEQGDVDGAFAQLAHVQGSLASAPRGPDVDFALARMHRRAGILEIARGKLSEAEAALRRSIARVARLVPASRWCV